MRDRKSQKRHRKHKEEPNGNLELKTILRNLTWVQYFTESLFKKYFIYLFLEREEGRKTGREISLCGCLSHAPYWRPGQQPRHVPWLGIKPATLWFTGQHSIHWATPARALFFVLIEIYLTYNLHWSTKPYRWKESSKSSSSAILLN